MRSAIWRNAAELALKEVEIQVTKPKEDSKRIWEQVDKYLPLFALFKVIVAVKILMAKFKTQ